MCVLLLKMCRRVFVVCCFLAAQISLFFVCLSEEEKSPFLIFLIFLLCVSSLSFVLHHNKNKRSLKDDDVFVFFSRDGQTNNCCEENDCD